MARSVSARVTLVFAIGVAAALGLCLILLYVTLDQQLVTALDTDLNARSDDLITAVVAGDLAVVARDPLAQLYATDAAVLVGSPSLAGRRLLSAEEVRRLAGPAIQTRLLLSGRGAESVAGWRAPWMPCSPGCASRSSGKLRQLLINLAHNSVAAGATTVWVHVTADAVVAAHGGTVEARNDELHGGAVVTVRLPLG